MKKKITKNLIKKLNSTKQNIFNLGKKTRLKCKTIGYFNILYFHKFVYYLLQYKQCSFSLVGSRGRSSELLIS